MLSAALAKTPAPAAHRCWERELVESVAARAAERSCGAESTWPDDAALIALCDDVLAGLLPEQLVFDAIEADADLQNFCSANRPHRRRSAS